MLRKCPEPESLLEFLTVAGELPLSQRWRTSLHCRFCSDCQEKLSQLEQSWGSYFQPEPDITSSLLKVYSRLQNDETLILKGWKLGGHPPAQTLGQRALRESWLFRGSVSVGMASVLGFIVFTSLQEGERPFPMDSAVAIQNEAVSTSDVPFARIRIEDKDRVKVHYIQPELLQTIEFETASAE